MPKASAHLAFKCAPPPPLPTPRLHVYLVREGGGGGAVCLYTTYSQNLWREACALCGLHLSITPWKIQHGCHFNLMPYGIMPFDDYTLQRMMSVQRGLHLLESVNLEVMRATRVTRLDEFQNHSSFRKYTAQNGAVTLSNLLGSELNRSYSERNRNEIVLKWARFLYTYFFYRHHVNEF